MFGLKVLSLVIPVFEKLKEKGFNINDPFLNQFIDYFEKEWINQDIKLWNYYNNFVIKTIDPKDSIINHINHIFGNKQPLFYNALYEFRILIKESLDSYDNQIKIHGSQQILREPLINSLKNFIDKYELDFNH